MRFTREIAFAGFGVRWQRYYVSSVSRARTLFPIDSSSYKFFIEPNTYSELQSLHWILGGNVLNRIRGTHLAPKGELENMSDQRKYDTLATALTAALFRLGVGTAVFPQSEIEPAEKCKLRCRRQSDGSVAVIVEPTTR